VTGEKGPDTRFKRAILAALPRLVMQWLPIGEFRGRQYVALNPNRNDQNLGSFVIDVDSGRWRDHAIAIGGSDPVSLFAYVRMNGDYGRAAKRLRSDPIVRAALTTGAVGRPTANTAKLAKGNGAAQAQRIYCNGSEIEGTTAEAYLRSRGLQPSEAWDALRSSTLRYPGRGWHPTLVAPFKTLDGDLSGIQRTFLQPNGTKLDVEPARLSLGDIAGCAVWLGEPDDELIICEGLEDGLTLHQGLDGQPVWVAGGAGLMATMAIPDRIRLLTIAADNDAAGALAADRAADNHNIGNRQVRIMTPSERFKDFNDELRGITRAS